MVVADPSRTAPYAEPIAKLVSDRLDIDYFELLASLRKRDARFQYLARRVPSTLATSVMAAQAARVHRGRHPP